MSSQGESPIWASVREREVPRDDEMVSPVAEVASVLQRLHEQRLASNDETLRVREEGLRALAGQAVLTIQLEQALETYGDRLVEAGMKQVQRHLRVIKDQMLDALAAAGLEVGVPLGQPFDAVVDAVHVEGWRHDERFDAEVVAEVREPIVRSGGRVVHQGRVVMGAPPTRTEGESQE